MFPRRDRVSVLCYSPTKIYANNITQHAGETLCCPFLAMPASVTEQTSKMLRLLQQLQLLFAETAMPRG